MDSTMTSNYCWASMKGALATIVRLSFLLTPVICGAQSTLSLEADAVRKYLLEEDYLELFKDKTYRVRVENLVVADFDNDGVNDVIAHFLPHYRQSAPIIFFRLSPKLKVNRVKEGLAPGPLQPLSGNYLDSHTMGLAIDLDLKDKQSDMTAREKFLNKAFSSFGGVVMYRNYFHVDGRSGNGTYIDMSHISIEEKNYDNFEFSKVRQIAVGQPKGQMKNYLAAWVGDEIYVYLIQGVHDDGLLDKQVIIQKAHIGFEGFLPLKGLAFKTKSGTLEILNVETK